MLLLVSQVLFLYCIQSTSASEWEANANAMVTEGPDLNTAANVLAHPASKGVQAAIHSDQTKLTPGQ